MAHAGPLEAFLTIVAGVVTGVLSAAFGVGGATISTPAIRLLGVSAAFAVGTTLPSILPSALAGTVRYSREGLVRWDVVAWTAPAGIVAAVAGSALSGVVPGEGHVLMVVTAVLLGVTAWRMGLGGDEPAGSGDDERRTDPPADGQPSTPEKQEEAGTVRPRVLVAVGAAAGMLSGLLGVGGGIVVVPGLIELAGIPIKRAIATSLACVGLFAVPATLAHWAVGDIDWATAGWLSLGVVPGARLGAVAAIRASERRLRRAVAAFLGVVAVAYGVGEVAALVTS